MFCNKCGKDFGNVNIKFCPYCGGKTDTYRTNEAANSKKDETITTNSGKPPVNKTIIIVATIIAVASVVIALLIISKASLISPDNGSDSFWTANNDSEASEGLVETDETPFTTGFKIESVGDIIAFGNWRGEPIEWRVLDIENDRALLISKDILTVRQYDGLTEYGGPSNIDDWDEVKVTWADSDIRAWLNDDFLNEAFSKSEQRSILLSEISNPYNDEYGTEGGIDTKDKIFFLSINEAYRLFKNDDDRFVKLKVTEEDIQYILGIANSIWGHKQDLYGYDELEQNLREYDPNQRRAWWWWLRSPGIDGYSAAYVHDFGFVVNIGHSVHSGGGYSGGGKYIAGGVRPALYIYL